VDAGNQYFPAQQPVDIGVADMAERLTTDNQRQYLAAGNTAHAGNNGHQYGQRHNLFNRIFEQANHGGGGKGRQQVDKQPDQPAAAGFQRWREGIFFVIQTGHAEQGMVAFITDNVDHVVDGDTADQLAAGINHRGGHQIVTFKDLGNLTFVLGGLNNPGVRGHHFAPGLLRIADPQV